MFTGYLLVEEEQNDKQDTEQQNRKHHAPNCTGFWTSVMRMPKGQKSGGCGQITISSVQVVYKVCLRWLNLVHVQGFTA